MGCLLWGRTESDTTEATQQQQQEQLLLLRPATAAAPVIKDYKVLLLVLRLSLKVTYHRITINMAFLK